MIFNAYPGSKTEYKVNQKRAKKTTKKENEKIVLLPPTQLFLARYNARRFQICRLLP